MGSRNSTRNRDALYQWSRCLETSGLCYEGVRKRTRPALLHVCVLNLRFWCPVLRQHLRGPSRLPYFTTGTELDEPGGQVVDRRTDHGIQVLNVQIPSLDVE